MLVAASILTMLLGLMIALLSRTSDTVQTNSRLIDSRSESRQVFSRMANDFSKMLWRKDLDYRFGKLPQDDTFSFFAEVDGASTNATRKLSIVEYRINTTNQSLERGTLAAAHPTFPPQERNGILIGGETNTLPQISQGPDGLQPYESLSPSVFRIETCFLVASTNGPPHLAADPPEKLEEIRAVVVGIATIDGRSRNLLSTAEIGQLAGALPDASDGKDILSLWLPLVENADVLGATANVPEDAAKAVRVSQRFFYLLPLGKP